MRKPNLNLDIEKKVTDLTTKLINEKRQQILLYCIQKKGYKSFDGKLLSNKYEKVQFYSVDVLTIRYNGELLFREYPAGSFPNMINRKYELAEDLK